MGGLLRVMGCFGRCAGIVRGLVEPKRDGAEEDQGFCGVFVSGAAGLLAPFIEETLRRNRKRSYSHFSGAKVGSSCVRALTDVTLAQAEPILDRASCWGPMVPRHCPIYNQIGPPRIENIFTAKSRLFGDAWP